jgi:hypothetical protein
VAGLLAFAAAPASALDKLPARTTTLTADQAVARTCHSRLLPTGTRGVARLERTVVGAGTIAFRTTNRSGDWDLALFDAAGRKRSASANGSSTEQVTAWVAAGDRVILQACRRAGGARTLAVTEQSFLGALPKPDMRAQLVQVEHNGLVDIQALEHLGFDVTETRTDKTVDLVLYSKDQLELLKKTALPYRVKVEDLQAKFEADRRADRRASAAGASILPTGRTEYRAYEDFGTEIKGIAEKFPAIAKRIELPGKSFQGRVIEGLEISERVNEPEDGRPVFLVVGVHHAREWPSAEINMEWAHYLVNGYGSDPRITAILKNSRVIVVPIINPDGFVSTKNAAFDPAADPEYTAAAASGTGGYRRKNCNGQVPDPATPCEVQHGIDPNRNYGAGWGGPGAAATPESQTYRGSGPFSEPETKALQALGQVRQITTMITIHNVAALVLRPPGRSTDGLAPDEERLKALGDAMQNATGYVSQYGWQLYDTSGTTEDWFYAATGSFGYTIELGPHDGLFHMEYKTGVINEWNGEGARDTEKGLSEHPGLGMREALLIAAEQAIATRDHGVVAGAAPPGAEIKLAKQFKTATSPVCNVVVSPPVSFVNPPLSEITAERCEATTDPILFDDKLETSMKVRSDGRFEYHANPSTRPFEGKAGKTETFKLTCTAGSTTGSRDITLNRGQVIDGLELCGAKGTAAKPGGELRCADKDRPSSKFTTIKVTRKGFTLSGRSADRACGTSGVVASVQVALGRQVSRKTCKFVQANGRISQTRRCAKPIYLTAKGAAKWTLTKKVKLAKGRYIAFVRATDSAKNREKVNSGVNSRRKELKK